MRRAAAALAALLLALPAAAFIPSPRKLADAAAGANAKAGRATPLRIAVALHTGPPGEGDAELIATGELVSEPRGIARLDLVGRNGVRERHLLRRGRVAAWRDGVALERPRALLPPLPLLQIGRGGSLRAALRAMGVAVDRAEMGRSPDHDCFVVGGREWGAGAGGSGPPSLWLDAYSFEIVRVDRGDGAVFRFGPRKAFGERTLPAWVGLEERGKSVLYLELRSAAPAASGAAELQPPARP